MSKKEKIHSLILIFAFLDLLIFPRVLFGLIFPLSLPLVVLAMVYRFNFRHLITSTLLLVVMFVSILNGVLFNSESQIEANIFRAFQLFAMLLYAQIIIYSDDIFRYIIIVLNIFFCYIGILLILFLANPELYSGVIRALYPEALSYIDLNIQMLRFAYSFSDPNAAGYLITIAFYLYILIGRHNKIFPIIATIAIVSILATQSRGAYICASIAVIRYMYLSMFGANKSSLKFFLLLGMIALSLVIFSDIIIDFVYLSELRTESEDEIGGGRLGKYEYFLNNFNIYPFGSGYNLAIDGVEFRPHSDIIRLNLAYGFFALPILVFILFPRNIDQLIFITILLVPLSVNSIIDDYRLFSLAIIIFGILKPVIRKYKLQRRI
jgi:hypothetical protein